MRERKEGRKVCECYVCKCSQDTQAAYLGNGWPITECFDLFTNHHVWYMYVCEKRTQRQRLKDRHLSQSWWMEHQLRAYRKVKSEDSPLSTSKVSNSASKALCVEKTHMKSESGECEEKEMRTGAKINVYYAYWKVTGMLPENRDCGVGKAALGEKLVTLHKEHYLGM